MTLRDFIGTSMQVCYCGEKHTTIPTVPLANHNYGCIVWDWALATRKITARQRTLQLDQYAKNLGDKLEVPPPNQR
jgi:hypothetical protein